MENSFQRESYFTHGQSKKSGRRFTICALIRKGKTFIGIAECSLEDQFSRKTGRKTAENKAVHNPIASYETTDKKTAINHMHEHRALMES